MAKQNSSKKTRSLILLAFLVTLSGCIVTYRDFPNATLESLPKNHAPRPLSYHVEPMAGTILVLIPSLYPQFSNIDPIGQPGYHQVAQTLEASGLFSVLFDCGAGSPRNRSLLQHRL